MLKAAEFRSSEAGGSRGSEPAGPEGGSRRVSKLGGRWVLGLEAGGSPSWFSAAGSWGSKPAATLPGSASPNPGEDRKVIRADIVPYPRVQDPPAVVDEDVVDPGSDPPVPAAPGSGANGPTVGSDGDPQAPDKPDTGPSARTSALRPGARRASRWRSERSRPFGSPLEPWAKFNPQGGGRRHHRGGPVVPGGISMS